MNRRLVPCDLSTCLWLMKEWYRFVATWITQTIIITFPRPQSMCAIREVGAQYETDIKAFHIPELELTVFHFSQSTAWYQNHILCIPFSEWIFHTLLNRDFLAVFRTEVNIYGYVIQSRIGSELYHEWHLSFVLCANLIYCKLFTYSMPVFPWQIKHLVIFPALHIHEASSQAIA